MKKFSVSIILLGFILLGLYYFSYQDIEKPVEANNDKQITNEINTKCGYYVRLVDNDIVVYEADNETVYEYTDILYDGLPEEIQADLLRGIYLENQRELYSFLENYSS